MNKADARIVFLGTPDFALPSLGALLDGGYGVAAAFTQPDKPVGRKQRLTPPPVKLMAMERGIAVYQFARLRSDEGVAALRALAPDLMVTAAFGQILSPEILAIPTIGCVNVHGSLLPKYRGAAPVQWAIINGEEQTGVTTMLTAAGIDTGDMLLKGAIPIGPDETAGQLFDRVALLGAQVLLKTLQGLLGQTIVPQKQDESLATHCPMLKKEHGRIDFTLPAQAVHNLVRGVNPWPGAYCMWGGEQVKVWQTRVTAAQGRPGQVLEAGPGLIVGAGEGSVELLRLQLAGGKAMDSGAFLRGRNLSKGDILF